MRFPRAAIWFVIAAFVFLIMFGVSSRIITEFTNAVDPFDDNLGATYQEEIALIPYAFAIISAILFVCGIIIVFFMDALGEEYEYYGYDKGGGNYY